MAYWPFCGNNDILGLSVDERDTALRQCPQRRAVDPALAEEKETFAVALYGAAYQILRQADRPHPCTETAAQALAAGPLDAGGESPKAKTTFLVVQGAMSFEESERTAIQDLAEQMQGFMASSGLDPGAYDLQSFTEERRSDLKVLCMAAVRKEAPGAAAAVLAEGRAEAAPAGMPPDEKIEAIKIKVSTSGNTVSSVTLDGEKAADRCSAIALEYLDQRACIESIAALATLQCIYTQIAPPGGEILLQATPDSNRLKQASIGAHKAVSSFDVKPEISAIWKPYSLHRCCGTLTLRRRCAT